MNNNDLKYNPLNRIGFLKTYKNRVLRRLIYFLTFIFCFLIKKTLSLTINNLKTKLPTFKKHRRAAIEIKLLQINF